MCAIVGLAVAAPSAMAATTRFVNDDAIPVGCPQQYPSISAALAAAGTGDTILVCPGVYNESPLVNVQVNIKALFPPPDLGTCNATRTPLNTLAALRRYSVVNGTFFVAADKVTIDSFVIQTGPWGIFGAAGSGFVFQNNQIQDTFIEGIALAPSGVFATRVSAN